MKSNKGFTLIELLAIIVILAVIMAIAIPQVLNVVNGSKDSAWKSNVKMIEKAIGTNAPVNNTETSNNTYIIDKLCENPDIIKTYIKSDDTIVTCEDGIFYLEGIGQFEGKYAELDCANNNCSSKITSTPKES